MFAVFEEMPSRNPMLSIMLGVMAITMTVCGYVGTGVWIGQFSKLCQTVIFASTVIFSVSITAHHVLCSTAEWFCIKLGRTEGARPVIPEFFKKTSAAMFAVYLGLMAFAVTFFIAVVTGEASLPGWCCVFNTISAFALMLLMKSQGAGNLAGAVMFPGLIFLI